MSARYNYPYFQMSQSAKKHGIRTYSIEEHEDFIKNRGELTGQTKVCACCLYEKPRVEFSTYINTKFVPHLTIPAGSLPRFKICVFCRLSLLEFTRENLKSVNDT